MGDRRKEVREARERGVGLAVIGGGAAGMSAAAAAAGLGLGCIVVERKARLGSKVLMTANGRCNFAKDLTADRFLADVGPAARFAEKAVRDFPPRAVAAAFESLGVRVRRMDDGRFFPADGKAASIVHAFGDYLRDRGVPLLSNCPVESVERCGDGFLVATGNFSVAARSVLLATGGASYPKLGSVGDGQRFAAALGHRIVPLEAGLTGVETRDPRVAARAGRRFERGSAAVIGPRGETLFACEGEIDCESFGVSGAAVYNCQRFAAHAARQGVRAADISLLLEFAGMEVRIGAPKARPLKEAIVTIGGVALDEVDPATMESRIVPGLYFAGEVLDIDGPTGGYNLTLAFATGRLAARSAARRSRRRGGEVR